MVVSKSKSEQVGGGKVKLRASAIIHPQPDGYKDNRDDNIVTEVNLVIPEVHSDSSEDSSLVDLGYSNDQNQNNQGSEEPIETLNTADVFPTGGGTIGGCCIML